MSIWRATELQVMSLSLLSSEYNIYMSGVKVWIDQDLCTGDGLCVEIEPAIFEMHDDGLAYVKEASWPTLYSKDGKTATNDPILQMADGMASVPDALLESCIDAAEECPGECIYLEVEGA